MLSLVSVIAAYEAAMHFDGVAIDGPFQLYNALRRIQAGFRPGVEFQFFHGLGVPYTHYWLYRLFGGGLRGSELARELISPTLYPAVYLIAFRALAGTWTRAFALTAAALGATYVLRMSAMLFAMNGMLSYRSALPTLIPVVMLLRDTWRRRIIAGLMVGLALFISTEQGLAITLALVLVSAVAIVGARARREALIELGATIGIGIAVLVLVLLMAGGWSGMRGALRYNFRVVPIDQYWYFGAPPNHFITSWRTIPPLLIRTPGVGGAIIFGIVAAIVYLRRVWRASAEPEHSRRTFALALLATYSVVSCGSLLGIFNLSYAQPAWRCLFIIGFAELARVGTRYDERRERRPFLGVPQASALLSLLLTGFAFTIPLVPTALAVSLPHIVRDHFFGDERFGITGIWPETLQRAQRAIDSHRGPKGELPTLWSTYAGWIEARNGMFHPSFDYIIHALGPQNRAAYVEKFRAIQPTLVQTMKPTYTQYEQWLEAENWPFYSALLDGYKVSSDTPWSLFWDRRAAPAEAPRAIGTLDVPAGATDVPLPPLTRPAGQVDSLILIEVEVEYETHNPLHALPLVGPSPRYLIAIENAVTPMPISLSPWTTRARFPLLVRQDRQPVLHFATFSLLPGAGWTARRLSVFVRRIDDGNEPWIRDILRFYSNAT